MSRILGYGLGSTEEHYTIVKEVCDVLGHGRNNTGQNILLMTAANETDFGYYRDRSPNGAGFGLTQIEKYSFEELKSKVRQHDKQAVYDRWGIDIDDCKVEMLKYSPRLAYIFARLFYKRFPAVFPSSITDLAKYYKKYYNTYLGKATVEGTLEEYYRYVNESKILR